MEGWGGGGGIDLNGGFVCFKKRNQMRILKRASLLRRCSETSAFPFLYPLYSTIQGLGRICAVLQRILLDTLREPARVIYRLINDQLTFIAMSCMKTPRKKS